MHKSVIHTLIIGLLAAIALMAPLSAQAEEKKASAEKQIQAENKANRIPFTGKLAAVDKAAMTITLDGKEKKRTIQITAQTRIAKGGKPATLEDAIVGEEVGGQLIKSEGGKQEALSLRLGAKPEAKPKESKVKKEKNEQK